jgi:hypothetical protein
LHRRVTHLRQASPEACLDSAAAWVTTGPIANPERDTGLAGQLDIRAASAAFERIRERGLVRKRPTARGHRALPGTHAAGLHVTIVARHPEATL